MIGGGMIGIGAIAHLQQKQLPRKRTNKSVN
jgi:hypothetical protein